MFDEAEISAVQGDPTALSTTRSGVVEIQMFTSLTKDEKIKEAE